MKPQILVVDDDSEIRETVVELLRERGHDAIGASDGGEALAVLRSHAPWGLILLDLMMPGMDGWAVCTELRTDPSLSTIPVVIVSATTEVAAAAEDLRAAAFLVKPVRLAELLAVVDRFVPAPK